MNTPAMVKATATIQNHSHQRVGDLRMTQNRIIVKSPPISHVRPNDLAWSPNQLTQPCTENP